MGAGATNETNLQIAQETNQANRDIAKETNETNLTLAREENAFNERMWNEANKYNEPAKQVQRFQDAGLSAAASAQAAGNVAAQPLRSANLANQQMGAPMQAAVMQPQEFLTTMRNAAQLGIEMGDMIKSLTTAGLERETILSENDARRWATNKIMQDWLRGQASLPYAGRQAVAETKSMEGRAAADSKAGVLTDLAIEQAKANRDMLQKQVDAFDRNNEINYQKSLAELDNLIKDGINKDKQGQLTDAQTAGVKANTAKTYAETENVSKAGQLLDEQISGANIQNRINEVQAILQENGYPQDFNERIAALMNSGKMDEKQLKGFIESLEKGRSVSQVASEGNANLEFYYWQVFEKPMIDGISTITNMVKDIIPIPNIKIGK